MADPYTQADVTQGFGIETAVNTETEKIEVAFGTVLNKDDATDNAMNVDLDMNGNDIINVGSVTYGDGAPYTGSQVAVVDANDNFNILNTTVEQVLNEIGTRIGDSETNITNKVDKTVGLDSTVSFTLGTTHHNQWSQVTGSNNVVITIPAESSTDLTRPDSEPFTHYVTFNGTGDVTVSPQSGSVTVVPPDGLTLVATNIGMNFAIVKSTVTSNLWYVIGSTDLE